MASSVSGSIPRFLLPQNGAIWRQVRPSTIGQSRSGTTHLAREARRHASTTTGSWSGGKKSKPVVLEKPTKFNPPSHGARLPRKGGRSPHQQHYGGDLSAADIAAQKAREYPGTLPAKGTAANWIWNSRGFHLTITLGTLGAAAVYTFIENFKRTSPFADMLPVSSEWRSHPFLCIRQVFHVIRLTEGHRSRDVQEKRRRRVDDVVKRSQYRKAHGLDQSTGFGSWTAKTEGEALGPAMPASEVDDAVVANAAAATAAAAAEAADEPASGTNEKTEAATEVEGDGKRKKVLGIF